MAKNDNAHAVRLAEGMVTYVGQNAACELAEKYPLPKSADIEKKHAWAENICEYLEERFEEEKILQIRKECKCGDGRSTANKLIKYLNQAGSIEGMVALFNKKETFASMEYLSDNKVLFCYPQCYCGCVKRVSRELSRTWCYCTLGYAESMFKQVLQKDVKATLLKSIKTGADSCVIEVEW
ncbi:MAG: hypothetical protein IJ409_04600 [Lachnospiraceae bacterium]|nr:hypothetical protein [Lachnospiraceae bacterium]